MLIWQKSQDDLAQRPGKSESLLRQKKPLSFMGRGMAIFHIALFGEKLRSAEDRLPSTEGQSQISKS